MNEVEIFTCNHCGYARSRNYYTKQGGIKSEDDENICDDCIEKIERERLD